MLLKAHKDVGQRLLLAGLPLNYVQRVVDELRDHAVDVEVAESCSGSNSNQSSCDLSNSDSENLDDKCLGVETELLANQFVTSYRTSKWIRRLPGICWLLFPVPLCLLTLLAWYAVSISVLELFFIDVFDEPFLPAGSTLLLEIVFYSGKLIAPVLAAWLLIKTQFYAGISQRGKVAGFVVLAIMFFFTMSDLALPTGVETTELTLTVDVERDMSLSFLFWQLGQTAVVLAILTVECIRWRFQASCAWLSNS